LEFRASRGSGWSVLKGWFTGKFDYYFGLPTCRPHFHRSLPKYLVFSHSKRTCFFTVGKNTQFQWRRTVTLEYAGQGLSGTRTESDNRVGGKWPSYPWNYSVEFFSLLSPVCIGLFSVLPVLDSTSVEV
jgi:hypothetical protein